MSARTYHYVLTIQGSDVRGGPPNKIASFSNLITTELSRFETLKSLLGALILEHRFNPKDVYIVFWSMEPNDL